MRGSLHLFHSRSHRSRCGRGQEFHCVQLVPGDMLEIRVIIGQRLASNKHIIINIILTSQPIVVLLLSASLISPSPIVTLLSLSPPSSVSSSLLALSSSLLALSSLASIVMLDRRRRSWQMEAHRHLIFSSFAPNWETGKERSSVHNACLRFAVINC